MLKLYSIFILILALTCSTLNIKAQEKSNFKEVVLDGKPAKLNLETGEITLIATEAIIDSLRKKKDTIETEDRELSKFHEVKEGESLLDISNQYKVSLTRLKKLNNLETTLINEGQVLLIDKGADNGKNTIAKNVNKKEVTPEATSFHKVQKGETLYSISKMYGLSVETLKSNNNLSSNLIKAGQVLRLVNDANNKEETSNTLLIKKGDTLYSIAKRFNTSVEKLKELNSLKNNVILVGQELRIR
ncbi:LysM peptidoglycan-binding domain-containing protein [Winogradskyella sp. DF17]|uniref:LysM peptidoglycan-binding domain-containing protein n=1 Tax=Winogradskyella pelagia TaxID=2819984 RepID=A0ABS3T0Q7_9FLAO|nr:LysM peptidoglycan-binding domain-containing protein [Winogradskyella sp. DF17]MBO3116318.1 LysM peptidoglycan-binding domain-containing protein [Winogradskyella sp. DF17]